MKLSYSPWGHEMTPSDNRDVLKGVRADYNVRSFPAEFSFVARNRDLEDDWDWDILNRKRKAYVPTKKDPYSFKSMAHYNATLAYVKAFVDRLEDQQIGRAHV